MGSWSRSLYLTRCTLSTHHDALIKAILRPEKMTEEPFAAVSGELFERVLQMMDNAGAADEHWALNDLAMRNPGIYTQAAKEFARDFPLKQLKGGMR